MTTAFLFLLALNPQECRTTWFAFNLDFSSSAKQKFIKSTFIGVFKVHYRKNNVGACTTIQYLKPT